MCRFEAGQAEAGAVAGVGAEAEAEAANWPHTLWLITSAESRSQTTLSRVASSVERAGRRLGYGVT